MRRRVRPFLRLVLLLTLVALAVTACGGGSDAGNAVASDSDASSSTTDEVLNTGEVSETDESEEDPVTDDGDPSDSSDSAEPVEPAPIDLSGRPNRVVMAAKLDAACEQDCPSTVTVVDAAGALLHNHSFDFTVELLSISYPDRAALFTIEPDGWRLHMLDLESGEVVAHDRVFGRDPALIAEPSSPVVVVFDPQTSSIVNLELMQVLEGPGPPRTPQGSHEVAFFDLDTMEQLVYDTDTFELLRRTPFDDPAAGFWSPDAKWSASTTANEQGQFVDLAIVSLDDPDAAPILVEDAMLFEWYDDDRVILGENRGESLYLYDVVSQARVGAVAELGRPNGPGAPWHLAINTDEQVLAIANIETGERVDLEPSGDPSERYVRWPDGGSLPNSRPQSFQWAHRGLPLFDPPEEGFYAVRVDLRTGDTVVVEFEFDDFPVLGTVHSADAGQLLLFGIEALLFAEDGSFVELPLSAGGHFCADGSFVLLTVRGGVAGALEPNRETDVQYFSTPTAEPVSLGAADQVVCSSNFG